MLRFFSAALQPPPIPISIPSISTPLPILPLITTNHKLPYSSPKFQLFQKRSPRKPRKSEVNAENSNGPSTNPKEETEKKGDEEGGDNGGGVEDDVKRNGWPTFNLRWTDLLLDPDPDNVVAVGLMGVLAWASLQVLCYSSSYRWR